MRVGFIIIVMLCLLPVVQGWAMTPERWVVYYTDKLPASAFDTFDLVVFDSDAHPPLAPLKAQGKTTLGYISLGEAEKYRSYFAKIKKKRLLRQANQMWKGHYIIDVNNPEWDAMVIHDLIPPILAQGFDGIMIDTIDSVTQFEEMRPGAIRLIKAIRTHYPDIDIMLNRGFEILPQVAGDIDMVMAESTYTDWQPGSKKAHLVDKETYQSYLDILKGAQRISTSLKIYTIDYWPLKDVAGVKRIYAWQREQGFVPYVGKLDLQSIHKEPQ